MEVVPQRLTELARQLLDTSQDAADAWTTAHGGLQVAGDAAGNTPAGPELLTAHVGAAESAAEAVGRLVAVLEQDMDGLYQCAFDFSTTDEREAETYESHLFTIFGVEVG